METKIASILNEVDISRCLPGVRPGPATFYNWKKKFGGMEARGDECGFLRSRMKSLGRRYGR